jgi:flagellar hook-associated protein 3 FlgL
MSLVSFGDLAQSNLLRRHTTHAKTDIARLSQELSTGRSADTARHVAGDLGPLLAIDSSLAQLSGYKAITREAGLFADALQTGLDVISGLALDVGNGMIAASGASGTTHVSTAAATAYSALQATMTTLNTRFGDRTLFAGVASNGPAISDTETLMSTLELVTAAATTVQDVETAIDAWFDAPTGYQAVSYRGGDPHSPVPVAAGQTVQLDVTANDPAIRETLKGLSMAALLDRNAFSGQTQLRLEVAQRSGEHLIASESSRAYLAARVGSAQGQIDAAQTRNQSEAVGLEIARVSIVEVDPHETATRLQNAETQLQLIYTLTARISRLSLADYL